MSGASALKLESDAARIRWLDPCRLSADWVAAHLTDLDEEERRRADAFRQREDRTAFVAAHWLKRRMLESETGVPMRDLAFHALPGGKPAIASASGVPATDFNLSHCRSLVVCGVCHSGAIGVDAEVAPEPDIAMEIATSHFSTAEIADLQSLDAGELPQAFLRLWTMKEAVLKALGLGLSVPLSAVSFAAASTVPASLPPDAGPPEIWRCLLHRPPCRGLVAAAVRGPVPQGFRWDIAPAST